MKIGRIACIALIATCLGVLPVHAQTPVPLVNPGFEAGLWGWTVFTTANGTAGQPPLPTTVAASIGAKPVSKAAVFVAGQQSATPDVEEGGGVYQWFKAPAGTITVSADVAGLFYVPYAAALPESARFWLVIDGQFVSQLDLGRIETWGYYAPWCQPPGPYYGNDHCAWLPGTASAVISGSARVGPGPHYVMIAITRAYPAQSADPAESPFFYQFLDNVTVTWTDPDSR